MCAQRRLIWIRSRSTSVPPFVNGNEEAPAKRLKPNTRQFNQYFEKPFDGLWVGTVRCRVYGGLTRAGRLISCYKFTCRVHSVAAAAARNFIFSSVFEKRAIYAVNVVKKMPTVINGATERCVALDRVVSRLRVVRSAGAELLRELLHNARFNTIKNTYDFVSRACLERKGSKTIFFPSGVFLPYCLSVLRRAF